MLSRNFNETRDFGQIQGYRELAEKDELLFD